MAEVLLFHHAQGQTAGLPRFADELRHAGHTVHTPDLFDGRTFGSIEEGLAYASEVGWRRDHRAGRAGGGRAPERARLRRLLARRGAGAEARADPPRRARSAAVLLRASPSRSSGVVAGRRAGPDPRDGQRPVLRRRGRPRRRPRDRRVDRGRPSCSSTPATSTTSPTRACRPTTQTRRSCSRSACSSSSTRAAEGR